MVNLLCVCVCDGLFAPQPFFGGRHSSSKEGVNDEEEEALIAEAGGSRGMFPPSSPVPIAPYGALGGK